jgi:hypothetical protein
MTAWNGSPAASADDADETPAGNTAIGGTNLNCNSSFPYNGLRFPNVTIPNGSTVSAATLTIVTVTNDDPNLTITAEAIDDAPQFVGGTGNDNISARAVVGFPPAIAWNASNVGIGSVVSPDFAALIQNIVNRAGWVSGNALALILIDAGGGGQLRYRSFDHGSVAVLNVTYTAPGGGGGLTKQAMYYAQLRNV